MTVSDFMCMLFQNHVAHGIKFMQVKLNRSLVYFISKTPIHPRPRHLSAAGRIAH